MDDMHEALAELGYVTSCAPDALAVAGDGCARSSRPGQYARAMTGAWAAGAAAADAERAARNARQRAWRAARTPEQRERTNARERARRAARTPEQREHTRIRGRERARKYSAAMTPEQRERRRLYWRKRRAARTPEQREQVNARRRTMKRIATWQKCLQALALLDGPPPVPGSAPEARTAGTHALPGSHDVADSGAREVNPPGDE